MKKEKAGKGENCDEPWMFGAMQREDRRIMPIFEPVDVGNWPIESRSRHLCRDNGSSTKIALLSVNE